MNGARSLKFLLSALFPIFLISQSNAEVLIPPPGSGPNPSQSSSTMNRQAQNQGTQQFNQQSNQSLSTNPDPIQDPNQEYSQQSQAYSRSRTGYHPSAVGLIPQHRYPGTTPAESYYLQSINNSHQLIDSSFQNTGLIPPPPMGEQQMNK